MEIFIESKHNLRRFLIGGFVLLFVFCGFAAFGQDASRKEIKGTVSDVDGKPIMGVTVRVVDKNIGTTTGENGKYSLEVPENANILEFSSIGYVTQDIEIEDKSIVNIHLDRQQNSLAEAVVVGYGTQKKANLTGSVATVDMDQIQDIPVSNLSAALKYSDKLPGVHVSGGESRPGALGRIEIRNPPDGGKNGGSNGPLYVIDDVVRTQQDFNLLDPSQVKSISVVKDATAAIYGARAAQGVILVTTKKGKKGKPSISYSSSYGVSDAVWVPKMMNGYEFAKYQNDILDYRGFDPSYPDYYTDDELAYFKKYNYDWFDMAWKSSFTTKQSINVSGGGDRATYFAGASYYYGDGNLDNINYDKWNFHASSDINLADHLKLGLSVNGAVSKRKWFYLKQGGEDPQKDVKNLLRTPQFIPPYIDGLPVELPGGKNRGESLHFFEAQSLNNYSLSKSTIMNVNANLEYEFPFIPGLKAKVVFNKNYNNFWGKQYGLYYNAYTFSMLGKHNHIYGGQIDKKIRNKNGDRVRINPAYTKAYQLNTILTYDRQFGKHHISVLALVEQSESYYETVRAMKEGVADVGMDYMQAAFGAMTTTNGATEAATLSYAGRVNYNYAGKYIAEFDWRYDASTKFAPEYRWGFFPSFSAAWILSKEDFFNSSFINFLKFRGSAGFLGRDRTSDWAWMQEYSLQAGGHGAVFGGNSDMGVGVKLENMPNPYIQWDNIDEYNFGIDAILFDNRLNINMDGYYNHGYNLLSTLSQTVPFTVGSQMPAENFATVNSMGYELTLTWNGKIGNDFLYSVTTGVGYENSKNVKIDVSSGQKDTWEDLTGKYNRNLGTKSFVYEGMFRTQEEVDQFLEKHPDYTIFGQKPEPGMLYYEDVRGPKQADGTFAEPDGKITEDDRVWLLPKRGFNKGVSFTLRWKGFQAHIKTSFSIGSEKFVPGSARDMLTTRASGPAFWTDHWTPENKDATYPAAWYHDDYEVTSSFWLRNASSFRINLINLSYNLDDHITESIGINSCRFYLTITNPLQIQNHILDYGIDYPELRTAVLGLSLNL